MGRESRNCLYRIRNTLILAFYFNWLESASVGPVWSKSKRFSVHSVEGDLKEETTEEGPCRLDGSRTDVKVFMVSYFPKVSDTALGPRSLGSNRKRGSRKESFGRVSLHAM